MHIHIADGPFQCGFSKSFDRLNDVQCDRKIIFHALDQFRICDPLSHHIGIGNKKHAAPVTRQKILRQKQTVFFIRKHDPFLFCMIQDSGKYAAASHIITIFCHLSWITDDRAFFDPHRLSHFPVIRYILFSLRKYRYFYSVPLTYKVVTELSITQPPCYFSGNPIISQALDFYQLGM